MWPGRVSSPGPLTYESGALPTALRFSKLSQLIYKQVIRQRFVKSSSMHLNYPPKGLKTASNRTLPCLMQPQHYIHIHVSSIPYLPYIFGRIKIIIFLLSEHLIWKKIIFF